MTSSVTSATTFTEVFFNILLSYNNNNEKCFCTVSIENHKDAQNPRRAVLKMDRPKTRPRPKRSRPTAKKANTIPKAEKTRQLNHRRGNHKPESKKLREKGWGDTTVLTRLRLLAILYYYIRYVGLMWSLFFCHALQPNMSFEFVPIPKP